MSVSLDGLDLADGVFFAVIGGSLALMTALAILRPETERVGVLRIPTTRGDRLFISLLGAAFIHLAWLGLVGPNLRVGPRPLASCIRGRGVPLV